MKISQIFSSIQAEGKYAGYPVLFIRFSGCTRKCDFCDSKYHTEFKEMSINEITKQISKSKKEIIVFTGGEPMLHKLEMEKIMKQIPFAKYHMETNGDIIDTKFYSKLDYICFSPKSIFAINTILNHIIPVDYDIKVVTDLSKNNNILKFATMLMPLTTDNEKQNKIINQKVWNYCVKHNIKYCLRQHIEVWGNNTEK